MPVVLLFVLVGVVTFGVIWYFTGPTARAKRLKARLQNVGLDLEPALDQPDIIKRITPYSDIALLDALFRRLTFTQYLRTMIVQADSTWTVGRLVSATLLIFVVVAWGSGLWVQMLVLRLILAAVLACVPFMVIRFQRQMRFKKFDTILPDAIDLMSRGLRAGHSVSSVIEMVGREIPNPVGPEFRKVFEQQNFGLPFRESLEALAGRVPLPDLHFVVTAILVQKESGGNLAEVLDKTGVVIRERLRLKGELAIYTAQGRLTGWILGLLPFVLFVLIGIINPNYTKILTTDPTGQKAVILGLCLMALGFYVIRKIVNIKV